MTVGHSSVLRMTDGAVVQVGERTLVRTVKARQTWKMGNNQPTMAAGP